MTTNCRRCEISAAFFPLDGNGYCEECKDRIDAVGRICACGTPIPKDGNKGYKLKCDDCNDYANKSAHAPRECQLESCKAEFTPQNGRQLYCSKRCRDEQNYRTNKVEHDLHTCKRESCKSTFAPSHGNQKYCDFNCSNLAQLERMANRDGWNFIEKRSCIECGDPVSRPRRNYCGDACAAEGHRRIRRAVHHRRKNRRNKVTE